MTKLRSKQLRVFAGPNGSGKTTLAKKLSKEGKFHLEIFVNADELEKELMESGFISLKTFRLKSDTKTIQAYIAQFGMSSDKLKKLLIQDFFTFPAIKYIIKEKLILTSPLILRVSFAMNY